MAEMHKTQPMAVGRQKSSLSTATNLLGAAISLALLVGVGIWGYKLLMRDVSGVPVVRAADGPMRIQPDDPGGQQAQNQGLSVNNVAAEGGTGAPADRLVLAPAPMELTQEDTALVVATAPVQRVIEPSLAAALAEPPQTAEEESIQLVAVEELAARLAQGVEPLAELSPVIQTAPTPEQVEEVAALVTPQAATEIKGGLKRSLRPRLRPVSLDTSGDAQAQAIAASVAGVQDIAPDSIPVGTRLAQLGAYDSPEIARAEWDRLNGRFAAYLEGKNRVIQKASSGGRTFYRLRAMGFADLSDARRFCSALVSEKADCIPVVTR
ncbi:MAG: SPOR domain-containing protein [Roseovarius sp.]|nr:SPOR domain-containing protein [Roseovarius sp.]